MKLDELKKIARSLAETADINDHKKIYNHILAMGFDSGTFYQELEMTSRFVDTHRDISYSNAHLQLHSHTFYELLYCRNSCGAEYLVGSERYRLKRGDLLFIPPGISHRPLLPENMAEPYKRYVLWLSPDFMDYYTSLFPYQLPDAQTGASMLRTGGTKWESLVNLFRTGVEEAEAQADGWEAAVIGNTITLLTQIKRATADRIAHTLEAEKPELLDRIMSFVETNYAKSITIADVAKEFFVSSSTVSHLFKQKLGISFYRFVTQRRLIAAKTLIEDGTLLESVAIQIGFGDYSSFYRAFKQEYGISPRKYRGMFF